MYTMKKNERNDICKCGHKRKVHHIGTNKTECYTFIHRMKIDEHYQCICTKFKSKKQTEKRIKRKRIVW
jgi:hypothetical protein